VLVKEELLSVNFSYENYFFTRTLLYDDLSKKYRICEEEATYFMLIEKIGGLVTVSVHQTHTILQAHTDSYYHRSSFDPYNNPRR
jgi:hypothetical protein